MDALTRLEAPWRVRYQSSTGRFYVQHQETREIHPETFTVRGDAHEAKAALNALSPPPDEPASPWAEKELILEVREHLRNLGERGMGLRVLAARARSNPERIAAIRDCIGYLTWRNRPALVRLTRKMAERILAIQVDPAGGAFVDARETHRKVRELKRSGVTYREIARHLGANGKAGQLSLGKQRVRQWTATRVAELHDQVYRVNAGLRERCRCPEWAGSP